MRLLLRIRPLLEHHQLPFAVSLLAVALTAPALTTGWVLDDYSQRIAAPPGARAIPKRALPARVREIPPETERRSGCQDVAPPVA